MTENSENDEELWKTMLKDITKLPDVMVKICRKFQPLIAFYLTLGSTHQAKLPVETGLDWLNRALKIVAFHTEHFARRRPEEDEIETVEDLFRRDDRLYFGGDIDPNGIPFPMQGIQFFKYGLVFIL